MYKYLILLVLLTACEGRVLFNSEKKELSNPWKVILAASKKVDTEQQYVAIAEFNTIFFKKTENSHLELDAVMNLNNCKFLLFFYNKRPYSEQPLFCILYFKNNIITIENNPDLPEYSE